MKKIRHFKIYFQMKEKFGNVVKNDILRQCIQGCLQRREQTQPVHYSRVPGICLYYIVII